MIIAQQFNGCRRIGCRIDDVNVGDTIERLFTVALLTNMVWPAQNIRQAGIHRNTVEPLIGNGGSCLQYNGRPRDMVVEPRDCLCISGIPGTGKGEPIQRRNIIGALYRSLWRRIDPCLVVTDTRNRPFKEKD